MSKKLSESRESAKHLSKKARPISKELQKKLEEASERANEKIKRNNMTYSQSNARAKEYTLSLGKK